MNIFCNNCAGGFIHHELYDNELMHPLYWTSMMEEDFVLFCKDYDTFDFNRYELINRNEARINVRTYASDKDGRKDLKAFRYEDGVEVLFVHYIDNYMEIYTKRLSRFNKNEDCLFILDTWNYNTPKNIIMDFINLDIPYKRVLIDGDPSYLKYSSDRLLVINDGRYMGELAHDASIKIKEFLGIQ